MSGRESINCCEMLRKAGTVLCQVGVVLVVTDKQEEKTAVALSGSSSGTLEGQRAINDRKHEVRLKLLKHHTSICGFN